MQPRIQDVAQLVVLYDLKADPQEAALERKARELERKKRELEQEVAAVTRSGLGQDLQPVPEPTVRDLSVSSSKPRCRSSWMSAAVGWSVS